MLGECEGPRGLRSGVFLRGSSRHPVPITGKALPLAGVEDDVDLGC